MVTVYIVGGEYDERCKLFDKIVPKVHPSGGAVKVVCADDARNNSHLYLFRQDEDPPMFVAVCGDDGSQGDVMSKVASVAEEHVPIFSVISSEARVYYWYASHGEVDPDVVAAKFLTPEGMAAGGYTAPENAFATVKDGLVLDPLTGEPVAKVLPDAPSHPRDSVAPEQQAPDIPEPRHLYEEARAKKLAKAIARQLTRTDGHRPNIKLTREWAGELQERLANIQRCEPKETNSDE